VKGSNLGSHPGAHTFNRNRCHTLSDTAGKLSGAR